MALPLRPMGSQGLVASMQGFGCMGLTAFYGNAVPDEVGVAVMEKAFELGVTLFDTAEVYRGQDAEGNPKHNEELVGKFAAKIGREKIVVATKIFPLGDNEAMTPEVIRQSLEGSLKRLNLPYVDLWYLHRVPTKEGLLNFMTTAKELVQEGKIKYVGLSEATPEEIRMAHAIHPLTAIQQEWSLLMRNLEADIVPTCRELGIGIVAYSPLCRGLASAAIKAPADLGKIGHDGSAATGWHTIFPPMSGENLGQNATLLEPLEAKAKELGVTPAQLSLAWVQLQGEDVFPIPGTTKVVNLESNVGAAKLALGLSKDVAEALSASVDWTKVAGDRYPEHLNGLSYEKRL